MIWDEHTYLMVDHAPVADEVNTSLVRDEAYKHPEPLVRLEDAALTVGGRARSLGYKFVVRDGGVFRAWYQVRGVREALEGQPQAAQGEPNTDRKSERFGKDSLMAYAESDDGIHFRPVRVGAVEVDGSKDNNLVAFDSGPEPRTRQCGFLYDPLDREYRYKCLYYRPCQSKDFEPGVLARYPVATDRSWWAIWGIARSKDGLSWEPPDHTHNLVAANPEHARLHRALDGGLVMSDQMISPVADWQYRNVKGWITYDGRVAHRIPDHLFKIPEHMTRCFAEFLGPTWDGVPWIQPHVGLACARKGPSIIALNGFLYGCSGREPGAETFAQVADVGLCISDTGIKFQQVWPFRPFIRRGQRDAWDYGMVAQNCIVDHGDRTLFYYTGGDVGNLSSTYLPGLAWVPRDRFGYRLIRGYRDTAVRPRTARITMRPVTLPDAAAITVNCSHVNDRRVIRVELADEAGHALPGYAFADCRPVTTEGLRVPVVWQPDRTAAELAGRTVQIRIELDSPDCGAVYFDSPRLYAVYTKPAG